MDKKLDTVRAPLLPTLGYKPRILEPKIEEFPCLVHKLCVRLTTVKNGVKNIQTAGYNGSHTVENDSSKPDVVDFILSINKFRFQQQAFAQK